MFNDIVIEPGQPARRKRQAPSDSGPGPGPMFNQDTPELTEQVLYQITEEYYTPPPPTPQFMLLHTVIKKLRQSLGYFFPMPNFEVLHITTPKV